MDFSLDARVVGFVVGTSLLTALLFGLAPAFFAARAHPAQLLRSRGDRTASGRNGWGPVLVAGEAALALGLLVSAGGMVKGFHALLQVDPGFDPEGVLTFQVALTRADYGEGGVRTALLTEAVESLEGLPGVRSVGAVQSMPLSGEGIRGGGGDLSPGREASQRTHPGYPRGVLPDRQDPLGKRIKLGGPDADGPWQTVVGVVGNVRQNGLDSEEAQPGFYVPYADAPQYGMTFLLKADGDPTLLTGPARQVLSRLAPTVPVFGVRTLEEFYDHATGQTRFYTYLMGTFSLTALILTLLGVGLGYALLRGLAASFYGVEPWNPEVYLVQAGLLLLAALVAVWLPSRSALKLDPARVLAEE